MGPLPCRFAGPGPQCPSGLFNRITNSVKYGPKDQTRLDHSPTDYSSALVQTDPQPRAVVRSVPGPDDQVWDRFRPVFRTEADDVFPESAENEVFTLEFLRADFTPA